jgi:hypothetical protein
MLILEYDGHLDDGQSDDHDFTAEQDLVYSIEEVPSTTGPARTSLAIEAPYSHHVLADRVDESRHGAGAHHIEWDAPETESGVDIHIESLEGSGDYHLEAKVIGTTEHLAAEAVLNREDVLMAIQCQWFDDCTFEYDGLQMRADGASFLLRFPAAAGLTYKFSVALQKDQQSGTHLRLAIFPQDSIGTASTGSGQPGQTEGVCGEIAPGSEGGASDDVVEMSLGSWVGPSDGRPTWGERNDCEDMTHVGPPDQPCDGSYRHFPGQSFDDNDKYEWTAPFTANYIMQVTANCDVACE